MPDYVVWGNLLEICSPKGKYNWWCKSVGRNGKYNGHNWISSIIGLLPAEVIDASALPRCSTDRIFVSSC